MLTLAPTKISNTTPLYCESLENVTTQSEGTLWVTGPSHKTMMGPSVS